jgi:uncharacterized membrane protein
MNKNLRFLCHGAIIGALYAVLTLATWSFSSMQIQVRVSEALSVLPIFTPAAIPGLFFGCLISNVLGSGNVIDMVFGSLTTLLSAVLTYYIAKAFKGKKRIFLSLLPPVVLNAIVVPLILYYGYGISSFLSYEGALPVLCLNALSVLCGQIISCYLLGIPLYGGLEKIDRKNKIFELEKKKK